MATEDSLLAKAINLFEFLKGCQLVKATPAHTTDAYKRDGSVTWFDSLPAHAAVRSAHTGGELDLDAPFLIVDRVAHLSAPVPSDVLRAFLSGALDEPDAEPELCDEIPQHALPSSVSSVDTNVEQVTIADLPGLQSEYDAWIVKWRLWAERELIDRPARELYTSLFSTHLTVTNHSEELEFILGFGLLAWQPHGGHPPVSRHLFAVPVQIRLEEQSGRLTVQRPEGLDPPDMEVDMLDPGLIVNPAAVSDIRERAKEFELHPFAREDAGALVQRLVHVLDAQGEYFDDDAPPSPVSHPRAAFAPALILRKRSQQGLISIFHTIISQLQGSDEVPAGLVPLVDPDRQPSAESDGNPGGIVEVDNELFLPLPVNEQQLQIIRKVDSSAQVLVQGPPGTGKTHTAAALLSHLLAQGKRVLVTAQTDRALIEVRAKLPHAIKPLSVSVVGSSRSDMSDLKFAVEQISARASAHDAIEAERDIAVTLTAIDELRRERAAVLRRLVEARTQETTKHPFGGHQYTLAQIAQAYQTAADQYGWIQGYVSAAAKSQPPMTNGEIIELLTYARDRALASDETEALQRVVEISGTPAPMEFAQMCSAESTARADSEALGQLQHHEAYSAVSALGPQARAEFQGRLREIALEASELEQRHESWMNAALVDVRAGKSALWSDRADRVSELVEQVRQRLKVLGPTTEVVVASGERGGLIALARALHTYLSEGGKLKTAATGQPQIGAFTNKLVKEAMPLFETVRVNHLPPTTPEDLELFLAHMMASDLLGQLDKAWPADTVIPDEDTLHERLQWHVTELSLLRRVLALADRLMEEECYLETAGAPKPDWSDFASVRTFSHLVDAAAAQENAAATAQPISDLHRRLTADTQVAGAAQVVRDLRDAVAAHDPHAYSTAFLRLERLYDVRARVMRRNSLAATLDSEAPDLLSAITSAPEDPLWDVYLPGFEAAWRWAATGAWIAAQESVDVNKLQATLTHIEGRIRGKVEHLAATRAWDHAVSPGRITGQAQADLAQYAQLVKGYGKGKGKYAIQKRGEIRRAMDRCRPAVPVWIMPIYRIAEQLRVEPNMFDVVIVDEASQAGSEAAFLQYLAPKIAVIGDDKQVSPAAVGVDQQQIRDLANQYLAHDRYMDSWQDPKRSLFDEAVMRFGGRITLTEHRRCMPEIIGFSNRVAYEPEGVRLIPVRQYGADRLEPIKAVHVQDGYEKGTSAKVNPAEVDAIVAQVEDCLADPRYDGMTMGVISLLGSAQAKAIEKRLLERIAPEEWATRDLRCGDSAEFQGSERDVMFLSMVKSPEDGARIGALTAEMYVQRYNVAASRAKDQMWLFHSVGLSDLGNPDDMRFALLDYVYGVIHQSQRHDGPAMGTVPDDIRVEPFDSLFEQRVFNKIVDRGYVVVPQFEASGYFIDLVVVGARGRLAIECDGDAWHGPDAYGRDLARQRDLERCGWQFFRIRESAYYIDPVGELELLWALLGELGIHPSGWMDEEMTDEEGSTPEGAENTAEAANGVSPQVGETMAIEGDRSDEVATEREEPSSGLVSDLVDEDAEEPYDGVVERRSISEVAPSARAAVANEASTAAPSSGMPVYEIVEFSVPAVLSESHNDVRQAILKIVSVEGPMMGSRLQRSYVHASGGQRVGKNIARVLNRYISSLAQSGHLVADNPTGEAGVKPKTYRLPTQPAVRVRELGPRSLEEVPPSELAALITEVAGTLPTGWDDTVGLYRAALSRLGLLRMTTGVTAKLDEARQLAEHAFEEEEFLADDESRGNAGNDLL